MPPRFAATLPGAGALASVAPNAPESTRNAEVAEGRGGSEGVDPHAITLPRYRAIRYAWGTMMRSPLRRWTVRVVLCLIFGAITTITVSWALVVLQPLDARGTWLHELYRRVGDDNWNVEAATRPGRLFIASQRFRQFISDLESSPPPEEFAAAWTGFDEPTEEYRTRAVDREVRFLEAAGWPMLSLYSTYEQGDPPTAAVFRVAGIPLNERRWSAFGVCDVPYTLPIVPIFPGFYLDTLIFAVPWFVILFAPGATRRAIRRTRGRCPRCGYNLRGEFDDGCSECGWNRTSQEPIS